MIGLLQTKNCAFGARNPSSARIHSDYSDSFLSKSKGRSDDMAAVQAPAAYPELMQAPGKANGVKQVNGHAQANGAHSSVTTTSSEQVSSSHDESSSFMRTETHSQVTKTNILKERTMKTSAMVQSRFGQHTSIILDSTPTFDDFLDALAETRLRHMPHDGSKWDKVLRWAEGFTRHVHIFQQAVQGFMNDSEQATRMIWGSCLFLLQVRLLPPRRHLPLLHADMKSRWDQARLLF